MLLPRPRQLRPTGADDVGTRLLLYARVITGLILLLLAVMQQIPGVTTFEEIAAAARDARPLLLHRGCRIDVDELFEILARLNDRAVARAIAGPVWMTAG